MFKFLVFCLLLVTAWTIEGRVTKPGCKESDLSKLDVGLAKAYIIGVPGQRCPLGTEDGAEYCKAMNQTKKEMKSFTRKCLHGLNKQISTWLNQGMDAQFQLHCVEEKRGMELTAKMRCINQNIDACHKCMQKYILQLQEIYHKKVNKLQYACCGFYRMRTCTVNSLKTSCNDESRRIIRDFITRFAKDALELACTSWKDGRNCGGTDIQVPSGSKNSSLSLYAPLMKVLSSIAD